MKLSAHMRSVLAFAAERGGKLSSGRYGWSEATLRALERRGLVRLVSRATWDAQWRMTEAGHAAARAERTP